MRDADIQELCALFEREHHVQVVALRVKDRILVYGRETCERLLELPDSGEMSGSLDPRFRRAREGAVHLEAATGAEIVVVDLKEGWLVFGKDTVAAVVHRRGGP